MANWSGWALPVITTFILLIFLNLTFKKREDYSIEFDNADFNYKYDLQVKRNGNSNREQNNHVLHHSQESRFRAATCQEDLQHIHEIENTNVEATSAPQLTEILYKSVARPVQAGCKKMVRLGMGQPFLLGVWDGHKYVCEDDFTEEEECLVYTIGVNNDASFEDAMASTGCEVYAHDHTVKEFPNTKYKNVHFVKLGIGASNTNEVKTLDTLLRDNGHSNRTINYLKVDVEGAERDSMMQWFKSGSLANVRQIGIEFHDVPTHSKEYFTIVQELYKLGFVTIMWDINRIISITRPPPFFEIVFRRSNLAACVV